jgi:hypothetical protein
VQASCVCNAIQVSGVLNGWTNQSAQFYPLVFLLTPDIQGTSIQARTTTAYVSEITALLYPSSALVLPGAWYTRPGYNGCSGDK